MSSLISSISKADIQEVIFRSKSSHLENLYLHGLSDQEVERDLQSLIFPSCNWIFLAHKYGIRALMKKNHSDTKLSSSNYVRSESETFFSTNEDMIVSGIDGVEEGINSLILGIKGQIDMIGNVKIFSLLNSEVKFKSSDLFSMPIEFKTGKWRPSVVINHRAQVYSFINIFTI